MKSYIFCLAFFSLFVTACRHTISNDLIEIGEIDYTFTDKDFTKIKHVKSKLLNDSIVHNPVRLALRDSVLFSVDASYSADSLIRVFSVDDGICHGSLFCKGNGPKEVLSIDNVMFADGLFWAYDITNQKWIANDFSGIFDNKQNEACKIVDFKKWSYKGINDPNWLNNRIVANNLFKYKERFSFYTSDGQKEEDVVNPRFRFKEDLPASILADLFSTHLTITPNEKKVVLAGRYMDIIEIYDAKGNLLKLLKGPKDNLEFNFDKQKSMQNSVLVKSPESCRAYLKVRATEDKIYALYSGKEKQDKEHYSYSKDLYVFSMEGKPLMKYQLDVPVIDFVIDEARNKIFAVAGSPESEIVSFDM